MVNGAAPNVAERSVIRQPEYDDLPRSTLTLQLASVADDLPAWGSNVMARDRRLREFWPTEPTLASAIYSIAGRNAAFSWTLDGPPRTVAAVQNILHEADLGAGWLSFVIKYAIDLLTCDNGAFIELIRSGERESDPVIGIANLDSGRCWRTGRADFPVTYFDRFSMQHRLAPHQVIMACEFPSPIETMNGVGLCAVSRLLRAAQLIRDISIFQREKASGRNPQAIHLVSGVTSKAISDAMAQHQSRADQQGLARFVLPLVLGSIDPTASVTHEEIPLASLPLGFDLDVTMRWYITQLAMALGADYADFAPLPGRQLGGSTEALVMQQKSRGKGPALFMKGITHQFNFHGVFPRSVTFAYDEQDNAQALEVAELRKLKAETRALDIADGVLTAQAARQEMVDDGDMSQEVFDALQLGPDLTANVTASDEEQVTPPQTVAGAPLGTPVVATVAAGAAAGGGRMPLPLPGAVKAAGDDLPPVSNFADTERLGWESLFADELARVFRRAAADLRTRLLALQTAGKGLRSRLPWARATKDEQDDAMQALADEVAAQLDREAWWSEFRAATLEVALPTFRRVALGAAQYNVDVVGLPVNMDLVNQGVLDFTRTYSNEWWAGLETTTRDAMRQSLLTWQEVGLGERGLPDLVDSLTPLFGAARAEAVAQTETTTLFNLGNTLAHRAAGIETEEFQDSEDSHVCPTCSQYNGKRFPVGEGPQPALHTRCRCARLPVANNQAILGL